MQNKRRQKKIILLAAIAIAIGAGFLIHKHHTHAVQATPSVPSISVHVQKPLSQSMPQTVSATGYLMADKNTIITPRASGYIETIFSHEGDTVKAGQMLFQLNAQTEKNALASAKANEALSQIQYTRDQLLLQKGFITQDICYTAKVTLKQNQASVQTAQTNLDDRTITAPFNGALGALMVSLGDYVTPGNTLTTLVDNRHMKVEYTLPVNTLNQLQLNQPVTITNPTNQQTVVATVSYISPAVDQSTQSIGVHARLDNQTEHFKPGEYVTITQSTGSHKNVLMVPEQSVMASINGYSVFIDLNNKAIRTPIKIGDRHQGNVIIRAGLQPDMNVIVAGQNEVKNNQPVTIDNAKVSA